MILGDTYDATPLLPLVQSLSSDVDNSNSAYSEDSFRKESLLDLLVHESTNAYLPQHDPSQSPSKPNAPTLESVTTLAKEHGHSTPQIAGNFAKLVKTERLLLNHLSVKYPDPGDGPVEGQEDNESQKLWRGMLREIERQAEESWLDGEKEASKGGEWRVKTARDFMEVEIPRRDKAASGKSKAKGTGKEKTKEKKKDK